MEKLAFPTFFPSVKNKIKNNNFFTRILLWAAVRKKIHLASPTCRYMHTLIYWYFVLVLSPLLFYFFRLHSKKFTYSLNPIFISHMWTILRRSILSWNVSSSDECLVSPQKYKKSTLAFFSASVAFFLFFLKDRKCVKEKKKKTNGKDLRCVMFFL